MHVHSIVLLFFVVVVVCVVVVVVVVCVVVLLFVLCLDGCQSSVTILPSPSNNNDLSITIEWTEADIGEMVYTLCPCGEITAENNLIASRYCSGDFITGGVWAEADTTACEFSDLARELCQLLQVS